MVKMILHTDPILHLDRKQKKVEELKVTFSETIEETEDDKEAPAQMTLDEMFQQEADPKYVCL